MSDVWHTTAMAIADGIRNPDTDGAGLIGKVAKVLRALGLDGEMPIAELRRRVGVDTSLGEQATP